MTCAKAVFVAFAFGRAGCDSSRRYLRGVGVGVSLFYLLHGEYVTLF